jgi:hypothetical protein
MVNNLTAAARSKKTFPSIPPPAPLGIGPVSVSSTFCGGNIVHVRTVAAEDGTFTVELNVDQDPYTQLEDTIHSQV